MGSIFMQSSSRPSSAMGAKFTRSVLTHDGLQGRLGRCLRHRQLSLGIFTAVLFCFFGSSLARASTYYLSPYGSDSNSGLSSSASWISPHHTLNCGDVIVAA